MGVVRLIDNDDYAYYILVALMLHFRSTNLNLPFFHLKCSYLHIFFEWNAMERDLQLNH